MKFSVRHTLRGRIRIHEENGLMKNDPRWLSLEQCLSSEKNITWFKIRKNTGDITIGYSCEDNEIRNILKNIDLNVMPVQEDHSTWNDDISDIYIRKLIMAVALRCIRRVAIPVPWRNAITVLNAVKYIKEGILCLKDMKMEVPVLDATAIGVSLFRGDFKTASSVMFLLHTGEILEEWTHKKSVGDLAKCMATDYCQNPSYALILCSLEYRKKEGPL